MVIVALIWAAKGPELSFSQGKQSGHLMSNRLLDGPTPCASYSVCNECAHGPQDMRATKLHQFPSGSEVTGVSYDSERLVVSVGAAFTVTFPDAVGFRVLDEGDLLEFWPVCSSAAGGIFEVHDGGWLAQETERKGFISASSRPTLREFMVTGPDDCVGVLAFNAPKVDGAVL